VDTLIKTHSHSIPDIIGAYAEVVVNFVGNQKDVTYCYDYMHEIIYFYEKNFSQADKVTLVQIVLYNLKYLSDTKCDNCFIIDIWAGLLSILNYFSLFLWCDLNKMTECDEEDQIKTVFEVLFKSSTTDNNENFNNNVNEKEKLYKELIVAKIKLIDNNKNLFDIVYKEC